jgi:hypothetical protein
MTKGIEKLEEEFDEFKEAYTKNGKELVRMATVLEAHLKIHEDMIAKVDAMYAVFNDGKVGTKIIKWIFGVMMAIGGLALLVKNLIK